MILEDIALLIPMAAVGISFIVFLAFYPHYGYRVIVFLIPYTTMRAFSENAPYLTVSKVLGVWLAFFLIVVYLVTKRLPDELRATLWPWLGAFLAVNLLSAFLSKFPAVALDSLRQLIIAFTFFALTLAILRWKDTIKMLTMILIASISINSLLSIYGYLFNNPRFAMDLQSLKRATGAETNPNHFAAYVLFSLPLLAHVFFSARRVSIRVTAALLFMVNVLAIVLSYSRAHALIMFFMLFLLGLFHLHRFRPRFLGFIGMFAVIGLLTALVLIPPTYWEHQLTATSGSDMSISRRFSYLTFGMKAFQQRPLLGSGPGTFVALYGHSRESRHFVDDADRLKRFAHNNYLEVLIGTGLIGLLLFLGIIARALSNFYQARKLFITKKCLDAANLTGAYGLSFLGVLFSFMVLSSQGQKYFWMALALSEILRRRALEQSTETAMAEPKDLLVFSSRKTK